VLSFKKRGQEKVHEKEAEEDRSGSKKQEKQGTARKKTFGGKSRCKLLKKRGGN